jgi:phage gp16-like protein
MTLSDINRNRFYTLLSVGKKELGMDEDEFRSFLKIHGARSVDGKISRTTMSIGQLSLAVEAMRAKGFRPKKKNITDIRDWRKPRIELITKLWNKLADAGVVKNRSEKSMQKWCARVTKKALLEWCTSNDLNNCVEALKSWCAREHIRFG